MNNEVRGINQSLQGFYKTSIVNSTTKEVVWQQENWEKNLILNQGMDNLYNMSIVDQTLYGIAGTGTRPNNIDSGTSAITQSGNNVFLYNAGGAISSFSASFGVYSTVATVGDVIKYSNNSESKITSVINPTNLVVDNSYTITAGGSQTFKIWKTSQSGLETEVKRSNTYVAGSTNCGSTTVGSTITHRRTYDFTTEVGPVSYNELGVGWSNTGATTVFSRILLGSPIAIPAGYNLRIIYDLQTSWSPSVEQYKTASVGGWPVLPSTSLIGSESIQKLITSTVVVASGASDNTTAYLDPYYTSDLRLWASTVSTPLAAVGSAIDRTSGASTTATGTMTKSGQILGNYIVDKTGTLLVGDANSPNLRSIGLGKGGTPYDSTNQIICFLFNQNQTKNSSQTLSFTYRWTSTRVLS